MAPRKAEQEEGEHKKGLGTGEAFKWQQSVGMQVSSGVRQLTQESGTQNKPNTSSTTCM